MRHPAEGVRNITGSGLHAHDPAVGVQLELKDDLAEAIAFVANALHALETLPCHPQVNTEEIADTALDKQPVRIEVPPPGGTALESSLMTAIGQDQTQTPTEKRVTLRFVPSYDSRLVLPPCPRLSEAVLKPVGGHGSVMAP
jgi:hypothetical protein